MAIHVATMKFLDDWISFNLCNLKKKASVMIDQHPIKFDQNRLGFDLCDLDLRPINPKRNRESEEY